MIMDDTMMWLRWAALYQVPAAWQTARYDLEFEGRGAEAPLEMPDRMWAMPGFIRQALAARAGEREQP